MYACRHPEWCNVSFGVMISKASTCVDSITKSQLLASFTQRHGWGERIPEEKHARVVKSHSGAIIPFGGREWWVRG